MWNSPPFSRGLRVEGPLGGVLEARLDGLQQVGLVVLDHEEGGAVGLEDHAGQRPLREQGVGGGQPRERAMVQ